MAIQDTAEGSTYMSQDEFLAWDGAPLAEWIEGEVTVLTVTERHQELVQFFSMLMQLFAQERNLGTVRRLFLRLDDTGVYRPTALTPEGPFVSQAIRGFWLNVDWIWRRPAPTLMSIMKEWSLI